MPQPKQLPLQRQGLATEAPGCRRCRQVLRTQEIAPEMRPTELAMGGGIRQVRRQSVAAQDAGKGRAEQVPQDVGSTRGGDGIDPAIRQAIARLEKAISSGNRELLRAAGGFDKAADRLSLLRKLQDGTPTTEQRRAAIDRYSIWSTIRLISPEAAW